jgi:hypothetical protein
MNNQQEGHAQSEKWVTINFTDIPDLVVQGLLFGPQAEWSDHWSDHRGAPSCTGEYAGIGYQSLSDHKGEKTGFCFFGNLSSPEDALEKVSSISSIYD